MRPRLLLSCLLCLEGDIKDLDLDLGVLMRTGDTETMRGLMSTLTEECLLLRGCSQQGALPACRSGRTCSSTEG